MFNFVRTISFILIFSFLIISCKQQDISKNLIPLNLIHLDKIEIVMFESFPIQANVIARGYFPDNCTEITDIIEEFNNKTITIKLLTGSSSEIQKPCSKVKKAFDEIIPLDIRNLTADIYTVKVNNLTTYFELIVDNTI
ncbi:MAG: hypothetical protein KAH84_01935 [Thiomargarita sp.]|nr:hypothetical protein [Thiomargarita sp.]